MSSPKILVVFHSGYGHTQRVAEAVAAGAEGELLQIDAEGNLPDGGWERLAAADAIVFGAPTYMTSTLRPTCARGDTQALGWITCAKRSGSTPSSSITTRRARNEVGLPGTASTRA